MTRPPLLSRGRVWTWVFLIGLLSVLTAYNGHGWALGLGGGVLMALCGLGVELFFRRLASRDN